MINRFPVPDFSFSAKEAGVLFIECRFSEGDKQYRRYRRLCRAVRSCRAQSDTKRFASKERHRYQLDGIKFDQPALMPRPVLLGASTIAENSKKNDTNTDHRTERLHFDRLNE